MPLIRRLSSALAVAILMLVWFGPQSFVAAHSFAAHMSRHIALVAIVPPLIVLAVAGTRLDPVGRCPRLMAPMPISLIELAIVWAWHVPALHVAAREDLPVFLLEQATFLCSGTALWLAAMGGDREQRRMRAGAGIAALLFTSMHMTLLGVLFALADRPLFHHAAAVSSAATIADQQLGGVIMLLVGGAAYLIGGLSLTAVALRPALLSARSMGERSA